MEHGWEAGENGNIRGKTCSNFTPFTKISKLINLGLNAGLRSRKLPTNRLSHDTDDYL